jgi:hypothetical protein
MVERRSPHYASLREAPVETTVEALASRKANADAFDGVAYAVT